MTILRARMAAAVAAVVLAAIAPVSSAMASPRVAPIERYAPTTAYDGYGGQPLGVHDHPRYTGCPNSSASEGNANQQTRAVKQYGQTSGGYRC